MPLRCSSCKKFGHGSVQCKPQIVKPPDGNLEAVPASVDQSISYRTSVTSRQRSSLRAAPQPLEGPDIASKEDLKKLVSSRIPNPPVSAPNSLAILLEADSGVNQTMKMASGNEGCHIIDIGSKRNTAELPLPEATLPCVAPLAIYGEINDVHSRVHFELSSPQLLTSNLRSASGQAEEAEMDEEDFPDPTLIALKISQRRLERRVDDVPSIHALDEAAQITTPPFEQDGYWSYWYVSLGRLANLLNFLARIVWLVCRERYLVGMGLGCIFPIGFGWLANLGRNGGLGLLIDRYALTSGVDALLARLVEMLSRNMGSVSYCLSELVDALS
ncbi:hypothetical protein Nepgr_023896 [Nepenthes gracilis]|uniref:Uncharacterized protein n=1 Tax=Nepenthes gracilis TaxID=150966 RepID=A0AAD3T1S9_NEPGR|nr:hypothetical protein Nepgr_023896 [Nepenthes gracilis]